MPEPKCFISYSWDSDQHKDWVRHLASELQRNGVVVYLDQWDVHVGADITGYMERSIRESDYVLLVCTPAFAEKANNRKGGVGYEQAVVTGEIFEGTSSPKKFSPILRSGDQQRSLPSYLKSRLFIDFRDDNDFVNNLDVLLRHIHESPKYVRPPLGTKPTFDSQVTAVGLQEASHEPGPGKIPKSQRPLKAFSVEKVKELRDFAFSTNGLDMSKEGAKQWALDNVERFEDIDFVKFRKTFTELRKFAFSQSGLDLNKEQSIEWAEERAERFMNKDFTKFRERFTELYKFAFSQAGLDMNKQGATEWALEKVSQEFDEEQIKATTQINKIKTSIIHSLSPPQSGPRRAIAYLAVIAVTALIVSLILYVSWYIRNF